MLEVDARSAARGDDANHAPERREERVLGVDARSAARGLEAAGLVWSVVRVVVWKALKRPRRQASRANSQLPSRANSSPSATSGASFWGTPVCIFSSSVAILA